MLYSHRYNRPIDKKYAEDWDEVIIRFKDQWRELDKFLQSVGDKRVVLEVEDIENFDYKAFNAMREKYAANDLFAALASDSHDSAERKLILAQLQNRVAAWFVTKPVTTWTELHVLYSLGAKQVYIAEELAFELKDVAKFCHDRDMKIRVYPNVAQAPRNDASDMTKFFIRPEDLHLYEGIIDIIEFWSEDSKQNTFRKIYQRGEWYGSLNELIKSFSTKVDNRCVAPIFGKSRLNCGLRCLRKGTCHICQRTKLLADRMKDKDLIFKRKEFDMVE